MNLLTVFFFSVNYLFYKTSKTEKTSNSPTFSNRLSKNLKMLSLLRGKTAQIMLKFRFNLILQSSSQQKIKLKDYKHTELNLCSEWRKKNPVRNSFKKSQKMKISKFHLWTVKNNLVCVFLFILMNFLSTFFSFRSWFVL